ncbi:MAG: hypothetical protein JXA37_08995 [Chloroflexia bacterium]|nr:hypothetical protein [Chloroflexia bacterium]
MSETNQSDRGPLRVCLLQGVGCGGCAMEARSALSPCYGAPRRGIVWVQTPAHADVLLLCGVWLSPLLEQMRRMGENVPEPWACLRMGDCGSEMEDLFAERELTLHGCPPSPPAILEAIEATWQKRPGIRLPEGADEEED